MGHNKGMADNMLLELSAAITQGPVEGAYPNWAADRLIWHGSSTLCYSSQQADWQEATWIKELLSATPTETEQSPGN